MVKNSMSNTAEKFKGYLIVPRGRGSAKSMYALIMRRPCGIGTGCMGVKMKKESDLEKQIIAKRIEAEKALKDEEDSYCVKSTPISIKRNYFREAKGNKRGKGRHY